VFGEQLGIKLLDLFQSSKDKPLAQEQLQPVLQRRFEPCLELWKALWNWADDTMKAEAAADVQEAASPEEMLAKSASGYYDQDAFDRLSQTVDRFLVDNGALVSLRCLGALWELRKALRKPILPSDDESHNLSKRVKVREVMGLLFPSTKKDWKGSEEAKEPGLLLLLRDELGSNAVSAASGVMLT
jgi:hypothetical protein